MSADPNDHAPDNPGPGEKKSVMEQLKEANHTSSNWVEFVVAAFGILSVTIGCTILMVVLLVYPIFIVVVGFWNMGNCPLNELIPFMLVVTGTLIIFSNVTLMTRKCCHPKLVTCLSCLQLPANFILLVFTFLGACWVYGTLHKVDTHHESHIRTGQANPVYCDALTYWVAFTTVTLILLVVVAAVTSGIVACCCLQQLRSATDAEAAPIIPQEEVPDPEGTRDTVPSS